MEKTPYILDNDLHIHTYLSLCSNDPAQSADAILAYAKENKFRHICVTDHYWDERVPGASDWYGIQNTAHIRSDLPLPQDPDGEVVFHFGCETDMDKFGTVGVSDRMLDELEWIIVPTTHLHMNGFTIDEKDFGLDRRAALWVERFARLLDLDLPFHKIGVAHLTCSLMAPREHADHLNVLDLIDDVTMRELFARAARLGAGIELNFGLEEYAADEIGRVLRPYRIAKECGCKFYFGSDAHHPAGLARAYGRFAGVRDALGLTEDDKCRPFD